jgi:hypothetical protein
MKVAIKDVETNSASSFCVGQGREGQRQEAIESGDSRPARIR